MAKNLLNEEVWEMELRRLHRRLRNLREVKAGNMRLFKRFRKGYKEKKLRVVADHYIRIVRPLDWTPPKKRKK